ncbi:MULTISPECIES: hypothetical protein [unclassified Streptomyces]|uniref:hypothetical protein n=1 Tax=unclassified Streptomyces TaxID=2593676 RepID=UPI0011AA844F|nr:hypothetical protein [Streptomyces sp. BK340]TVZ77758.1 hypothetical protein FB157_13764 [Streptomyces sp. BK340]
MSTETSTFRPHRMPLRTDLPRTNSALVLVAVTDAAHLDRIHRTAALAHPVTRISRARRP